MDSYTIVLAPMLYLEGFNPDGGTVGTHRIANALRYDTKLEALEAIRRNNLTAGAKVVLCPPVESR